MLRDALPKIVTPLPGPKSQLVIDKRASEIPSSISCATPCAISRAEGAVVEDLDGNIFLDFVGGIGVMNIGHSDPEVVEAVKKQADRYFHPQINTFHYSEYVDLAERLNRLTPGSHKKRTAFFNCGSEAVDNAVKIARCYTKRPNIIAFTGAFHGRTYMAMTLTASANPYQTGFGPLCQGVYRAPYPDLYHRPQGISEDQAVDYYLKQLCNMLDESVSPDTVAAVILEPVQGESGFVAAPIAYVKELRKICDRHGILLIADEIQTGYCRTGRMFATEYWADAGVYPDLMTSAKSIAAGIPISAVTGRDEVMEAPALGGQLGGTYGGNPLACAAAMKVLEIMERDDFAAKARAIGDKTMKRFREWYEAYPVIGDVRGTGAMLSLEFVKDRETKEPYTEAANTIMAGCKKNGLVVKNAGVYGQTIRLLMPLCLSDEQLTAGLDILEKQIALFVSAGNR